MNRAQFIGYVSNLVRAKNIRKSVKLPKHVFTISDDEGTSKSFVIKGVDKSVIFTEPDVAAIIDTCIEAIIEIIATGESIDIHGLGSLGVHFRKKRTTKLINNGEPVSVEERYVPKFQAGKNLKISARRYELKLKEENGGAFSAEDNDKDQEA